MSRLAHAVDILVFNPPYVPTYDDEMDGAQHDAGIAGSWAGGIDGMQVTKILLGQVDVGNSPVTLWMYGCTYIPVTFLGPSLTLWAILLGGCKTKQYS